MLEALIPDLRCRGGSSLIKKGSALFFILYSHVLKMISVCCFCAISNAGGVSVLLCFFRKACRHTVSWCSLSSALLVPLSFS